MTHEELQELLNTDITQPHPDPDWDYYQLWEGLNKIKNNVSEVISFISQKESSTEDIDKQIHQKLSAVLASTEDLMEDSLDILL